MKFVPYALLLLSFAFGFAGVPYIAIAVMAVISTIVLASARRNQLKSQPQAPDQNMVLDGAFLFFQQTLIHFVAFALGLFLAYMLNAAA